MSRTAVLEAMKLKRRYQIRGEVRFETAWRIGSGREGQTMSDLGVMLDPDGSPVLPGSSLKGKLRSTCESLANALSLSTCLLDHSASSISCTSDIDLYSVSLRDQFKKELEEKGWTASNRLDWIERNTCDVCKLFGSPVRAARLRCADGRRKEGSNIIQVRDGVVLDRDSHTAVSGLKYDYEVVPAGTRFGVRFDVDNPTDADLALLGAALFEWNDGSSLGGFTSRGLGRFRLEEIEVWGVDFADATQLRNYLTQRGPDGRMTKQTDWQTFFSHWIQLQLQGPQERVARGET
jgi:CRISPR-associated RAMP protein (TIGR02581 family)